jgi:hypothetical protein
MKRDMTDEEIAIIENLDRIDANRCGHDVPMEIDCEECDYENMLADSDR